MGGGTIGKRASKTYLNSNNSPEIVNRFVPNNAAYAFNQGSIEMFDPVISKQ
jgi:hypothetical protein